MGGTELILSTLLTSRYQMSGSTYASLTRGVSGLSNMSHVGGKMKIWTIGRRKMRSRHLPNVHVARPGVSMGALDNKKP